LDDPVTTMEFVVRVLTHVFQKDSATAARLMWEVHSTGAALVATLPLEQAELKQAQVHAAADAAGFPFRCVIEPA
jgi:ATP-dependent Clp protease adaptor protein ClpS